MFGLGTYLVMRIPRQPITVEKEIKGDYLKALISTSVLLAMVCSFNYAGAAAAPHTKEVTIAVNDVLVPEDINENTDAKIVLTGMLPNTCYSWSRSEVTSPEATTHQIKAMAMVTVNTNCLMVLVPYTKVVNLGRLSVGEHTLRFMSGDDTYFERQLVVQ